MTEPKLILPLYPVTNITIGPLPEHRMIVLRPDFLSPALPSKSKNSRSKTAGGSLPQQGRTYVLSRSQARYLQEQLQRSLQILDAEKHQGSEPGLSPDSSPDK